MVNDTQHSYACYARLKFRVVKPLLFRSIPDSLEIDRVRPCPPRHIIEPLAPAHAYVLRFYHMGESAGAKRVLYEGTPLCSVSPKTLTLTLTLTLTPNCALMFHGLV